MPNRNYSETHASLIDLPFEIWKWDCSTNSLSFESDTESFFNIYINKENKSRRGWRKFIPEAQAEELERKIHEALKTNDRFHLEFQITPTPGEHRVLILHGLVTRKDDKGVPTLVQGIARPEIPNEENPPKSHGVSLEERRRLENLIIRAQRFEGIGKLAGGVAHDLNNLLAPIRMATELLTRKMKDASLSRYIEIIQSSTDRARAVIQQVLALSKGSEDETIEIIYVNDIIKDLEIMVRETFPRRININIDYGSDIPSIKMDPNHLHQALLNLLINARDAIQENGHISICTKTKLFPIKIAVGGRYFKPGNYVCIEIKDDGCGIEEAYQERIFDPFFTTKDKDKGTGLGLATAYGIIAHAGGFIDVESCPGKGSRFVIYLPQPEDILSNDKAETPLLFPPLEGKTILVVDDEINVLQTLCQVLEGWGMIVSNFHDPQEALKEVVSKNLSFDFALIDIHMPDLGGDELIKELEKTKIVTKSIVITGDIEYHPDSELKHVEVVRKPFKINELRKLFLEKPSS